MQNKIKKNLFILYNLFYNVEDFYNFSDNLINLVIIIMFFL